MNWLEILGWGTEELEDLRFVGYCYLKQGKYQLALNFFEALVVLNPQSTYDLQTLGALYLQMGRNLPALTYIERALKIDPSHLPTQLNRAKALFALGYQKQAVAQSKDLQVSAELTIADQASALLLAYA